LPRIEGCKDKKDAACGGIPKPCDTTAGIAHLMTPFSLRKASDSIANWLMNAA
jgi:hypothetical protein